MRINFWTRLAFINSIVGVVGIALTGAQPAPSFAQANNAPCGVIDAFDFPIADIDTHTTDFGIYRTKWGGLHTGIDVAFNHFGMPVRAAARGEVTFSDPAGWDTEKGVVVIQHTLPDGAIINTVYGHMEETDDITFPIMGQCIERGEIVGTVGDPLQSLPHLHYETRTRYSHEGGPGYTETNPLDLGWLHPVDFTYLARVMLLPAYRDHLVLNEKPTQPPLLMLDGTIITAHDRQVIGRSAAGEALWQFDILTSVTGLYALADGRALITLFGGQVLVLNHGSYSALWQTPPSVQSPVLLPGDRVILATNASTLAGYTPDGAPLWETSPFPASIAHVIPSGDRIALVTTNQQVWIVDDSGTLLDQFSYASAPLLFPAPDNGFVLLDGATIYHIDSALTQRLIVDTTRPTTTNAVLLSSDGMVYFYAGEGRSLYAYDSAGVLRWIGFMPGDHSRAPLFALGGGTQLYALTADGQLLAFATIDGRLLAQVALYDGGSDGTSAARWLTATSDDTIRFSSGYLSVVALNGLALAVETGD